MFNQFDLVVPRSLDEALAAMADANDEGATLALSGGTSVIIDMRARRIAPEKLISLGNVADFKWTQLHNGRVEIGGGTTISDVLYSSDMPNAAPSLFTAAQVFGGQMVRNAATIAGNICSGSPAADTVPPLLTLDADITLSSAEGDREVKLNDFYTGFKQDVRQPNEIVTRIGWDRLSDNACNLFYKLGLRKGDAITVTGVAVTLVVSDGICERARIALNSVAPIVKRATGAEQMLEGQPLTPELIEETARQAVTESSPIDDVRASAEYRRHAVFVLTRRLLNEAWARLQTGESA
ncbi:MAG: xanthine dehydrogenase family protein subunit M [Gammaproteobacteria bacterium]|jgi:carbon-monoxide dehydrogenase medium subunit|nr:xanthine dehydrogenase family protein subunit M [Gammaproteobacteria bacterium]MDP7297453.1 xanthine dehydrogenase family protein subunit M [Gammaproteobacteria bacterium]